jgi:hypothetical protein
LVRMTPVLKGGLWVGPRNEGHRFVRWACSDWPRGMADEAGWGAGVVYPPGVAGPVFQAAMSQEFRRMCSGSQRGAKVLPYSCPPTHVAAVLIQI